MSGPGAAGSRSTDPIRRLLRVRGAVQGVGFRYSLARVAREHSLGGYVRNLTDGSVEAVLEGPAAEVETVQAWAARGPAGASVHRLEVIDQPPQGTANFSVRPSAEPGDAGD